jgi:hypothetical protein
MAEFVAYPLNRTEICTLLRFTVAAAGGDLGAVGRLAWYREHLARPGRFGGDFRINKPRAPRPLSPEEICPDWLPAIVRPPRSSGRRRRRAVGREA